MNPNIRQRRQPPTDFTLVKVIVMVTIVAILGNVVATTMLRQGAEGKAQAALGIRASIQQYLLDQTSSPSADFNIEILRLRPEDGGRNGPYLNSDDHMFDPWNNPYYVLVPGDKNADYDVISYSEGGQLGGEGPSRHSQSPAKMP